MFSLFNDVFSRKPTDLLVATTYKCNSRCEMCNIWKDDTLREIPFEVYDDLPSSLNNIAISGGETLQYNKLLPALDKIIAKHPKAYLTLSTNGLLTRPKWINKLSDKQLRVYRNKIGIQFSLDGPEAIHDQIRGVKGNFQKVVQSVKDLKKVGFKDIRLSFTISDSNVEHVTEIYHLAEHLKVNFTAEIVQNSNNYFNIESNQFSRLDELKKQLNFVIKKELGSFTPKKWASAYFYWGMYFIKKTGNRPIPCNAVTNATFIDPDGAVFPCIYLTDKIGDMSKNTLGEIISNPKIQSIKDKVKNCPTPCWQKCTARISILKNIHKVLAWVFINKIKLAFGIPPIR